MCEVAMGCGRIGEDLGRFKEEYGRVCAFSLGSSKNPKDHLARK
jgi:hypothetical protein